MTRAVPSCAITSSDARVAFMPPHVKGDLHTVALGDGAQPLLLSAQKGLSSVPCVTTTTR